MLTVAHITMPGHMSPSLARVCGELLAGRSSQQGLGTFISLALLYQSWEVGTPCGLGSLFIRMRKLALSKQYPKPLSSMVMNSVYMAAIPNANISQAAALAACNAAKNMANELNGLEGVTFEKLQDTASKVLNEVLGELIQSDSAPGRFMADALCEQIANYNPELTRTNDSLFGHVPEEEPVDPNMDPSAGPTDPRDAPVLGYIQVMGPDGQVQGRFLDPALAAQFTQQMSMQVARRAAVMREEQLALKGDEAEDGVDKSKPHLQIFDRQAVIARLEKTATPSSPLEGNNQQHKLLERMANESGIRQIVEVPEGDVLAEMYQRFPHFSKVLNFVKRRLALAACGDEGRQVRIPPILLRGDPGVGKTYFAQELARVLGTHFIERDLSVTTEAFVISGMDSSWKGSKPGVVFDALVNGSTANPLILLNEIDKAQSRGTHNSPISSLYSLLEPDSASRFVDEFVPVEIDTSRVIWICTANEGEIPDPILTRLEVFDILAPTYEESRQIASSVWTAICTKTLPRGHGFPTELPESVLSATARMSPRVMRKALTMAAGAAVEQGKKFLLLEHLEESQERYAPASTKIPMGFVPSN